VVLAPLALMPGMAGALFRPLALAVAFAMLCSFFLSRTFVPMMCAKFLPDEHRGQHGAAGAHAGEHVPSPGFFARIHGIFDRLMIRQTKSYERTLALCLRNRVKVLVLAAVLFLGS